MNLQITTEKNDLFIMILTSAAQQNLEIVALGPKQKMSPA